MPPGRSRSQSTSSPNYSVSTPNSPLLSRGFASLRRSHRHTASATEQRQNISAIVHPPTTSASTPRHGQRQSETELVLDTGVGDGPSSSNTGNNDSATVHEPRIRLVPNVGMSTRCFVFDVIERTLPAGVVLKLGRYSDRNACSDRLSFKSKVVSRCHAELWQENGKIFIKDAGSSSGTFVNRARLSPANTTSRPHTIQDGDLIQMGVDYKGGGQAMYRAVRMRFEVDRLSLQQTAFSRVAFRQLKHCLRTSLVPAFNTNDTTITTTAPASASASASVPQSNQENKSLPSIPHEQSHIPLSRSSSVASTSPSVEVQECCICLYSMGPGQALFIAPCSHIYHYRCLRPLLTQNFPGFSCPLCRTYSDLDATVNIEKEQVEQMLQPDRADGHRKKSKLASTIQRNDSSSNTSSNTDHQIRPTATTELVQSPASSESDSSPSQPHLLTSQISSTPTPEMHASCRPDLGHETMMDPYTATSTPPGTTTITTTSISSPSSSSDDDDHQQAFHHHLSSETHIVCPTTITPAQHTETSRQHKSTGTDGLLSTTLVGSPSPFDLMVHQHAIPPSSSNVNSPVATATTSATIPPSTTLDASPSHHHQQS